MKYLSVFLLMFYVTQLYGQNKSLQSRLNFCYGISGYQLKKTDYPFNPKGSYSIGLSLKSEKHRIPVIRISALKHGVRSEYQDLNINAYMISGSIQFRVIDARSLSLDFGPYISAIVATKITSSDADLQSAYNSLYRDSDYGFELVETIPLSSRFSVIALQRYGLQNMRLYKNPSFRIHNYFAHFGLFYKLGRNNSEE